MTLQLYLGVALHHDVIDVRLQSHADVFALLSVELEDVQNTSNPHLEEHSLTATAELHNVTQLSRVQVLLGHRSEEVHASLIDTKNQLGRQQPNWVLNPLDSEKD